MTPLQSGHINVGSNTPTGAPMQIAVDNPYMCKDEFLQGYGAKGLGITVDDPEYSNGELDRVLLNASAIVNRHCRKWFDTQTIDEQKTRFQVRPLNPQLLTVVLNNRPYSKINSIYIQVLKWFIQVDTGPTGYLQDFYPDGYYKIVPMLSSAGTGIGSPIPAAILDRQPLGVLWTNYTFGFGTPLASQTLTVVGTTKQYQAPLGNRLWAPSQTFNVYDNAVLVVPANYTVDYPNGMVTFVNAYTPTGPITADFTTNDSLPFDIKAATKLVAQNLIAQDLGNPMGVGSMSIQTYSSSWAQGDTKIEERFKKMLEPYVDKTPMIF